MPSTNIEKWWMTIAGILTLLGAKKGLHMDAWITTHPFEFLFIIGLLGLGGFWARWIWRLFVHETQNICGRLGDIEKAIRESKQHHP